MMSFNVLGFVTGASYPTRTARLYLKGEEGARLNELKKELSLVERDLNYAEGKEKTDLNKKRKNIKAEMTRLREVIESNAVRLELRGYPEHVRTSIVKSVQAEYKDSGLDDNEIMNKVLMALMAATVQKVYGPDGTEDTTRMDANRLEEVLKELPQGGANEFFEKANDLSVLAVEFESGVTESF